MLRSQAQRVQQGLSQNWQQHFFKLLVMGLLAYALCQKDVQFDLALSRAAASIVQAEQPAPAAMSYHQPVAPVSEMPGQAAAAVNVSHLASKGASAPTVKPQPPANVSQLANTYSNLTQANKGAAKAEPVGTREAKRKRQQAYVGRFSKVAQEEMKKFGLPASIILAQGLLESNVGESRLASQNNNHFGVKCFSKSCAKGHCSNFTDDSHKDFFRIYKSAWESYRAHSLLIKHSERYQGLFKYKRTNYKAWAKGLQSAGYATDSRYAEKLIHLIEDLNLQRYDK